MTEIVIRCDASPRIGFGHLTRCIALAQAFQADCGLRATLLMRQDASAAAMARRFGVSVLTVPDANDHADEFIQGTLAGARALLLDYRDHLGDIVLAEARRLGVVVATIDDPTPRRLQADLAFYPPIPQLANWDWSGFDGQLLAGWEWVVIRRDLGPTHIDRMSRKPRLLISMGGSDPHDMTTTALSALDRTRATLDATIVLGPANPHRERVLLLTHRLAIRCLESPPHFPDVVRVCDIALVSFGVTAYELAACRVPALYLCLSDDHASSASVFENARIGAVVGTYPNLSIDGIARSLEGAVDAFQDPDSWLHRVPAVVDGQGSVRVARRVAAALRGS